MRMHAARNRDKGCGSLKDKTMATARIFQRPKNAMQSGRA
ncbi:MAG: hypothetical protein JWN66_4628, partial [Sphingomonas bacterium]|nr:hypothetical protein [Sphingomonas bacterium]